jgi:hypothetical protein
MARAKIKREILAAFMESPFYFDIPLRQRLEFLHFSSQQSIYHRFLAYNEQMIKGQAYRTLRDLMKPK